MDFEEYIRQGEPGRAERAGVWQAAIGLQAVDGLQTSEYLKATACRHIEGDISIDEACSLIETYYRSRTAREADETGSQETDKVSANITRILSANTISHPAASYRFTAGYSTESSPMPDSSVNTTSRKRNGCWTEIPSANLNFLKLYLLPAQRESCVEALYPDRPHHPRQKYRLTAKGRTILQK